ncbi:MAG TPA: hypothetical protein VHA53_04750 [Nitrolancea sp.]|nr:hypothetical protein [Nitrolancea sp.]
MASKLRRLAVIVVAMMLLACSPPWDSGRQSATMTPASVPTLPVPLPTTGQATNPPTPSLPTATPVVTPSPSSSLRAPTGTPVSTPSPAPSVVKTPVARCCGIFQWIDAGHLLVFDAPAQNPAGAWVVDVISGAKQLVAPNFGIASPAGLVAIPDPAAGQTEVRTVDGSVVSTVGNGGVLTWISPDGSRIVWLEELGTRQGSSLEPRSSRLWAAGIDGTGAKALLEFRASEVHWLPDNRHVLALARRPDGGAAGIWVVDTTDGTNGVVIHGSFLQALRLAPDGSRMAYLVTFSGQSTNDGIWVANTDGSAQLHLRESGSYRWAGDAEHLWFLELAPREGGNDSLVKVNVADDAVVERVELHGRVLNDRWEVSPNGAAVAFWNEADQSVLVQALPG